MVLASVKLSMPGGPRRKRKGDDSDEVSSSIPGGDIRSRTSGPRTRRRGGGAPSQPAQAGGAPTAAPSPASPRHLQQPEVSLTRTTVGDNVNGHLPSQIEEVSQPPPPRPGSLRIRLSVKRTVSETSDEVHRVSRPTKEEEDNKATLGTAAGRSSLAPKFIPAAARYNSRSSSSSSSSSSKAFAGSGQGLVPAPRDARRLIEAHRKDPCETDRPGVWVCRHCGAQRKEAKRGAALSNLLNHLRKCVKADDVGAEDEGPHVVVRRQVSSGLVPVRLSLPAKPAPAATGKAGAQAASSSRGEGSSSSSSSSSSPSTLIVPCRSDVCLGDGTNRGYRLLQDAVKGVRMGVSEENWEYMAVSQTLEGLRRLHAHPAPRFLVRAPDHRWVEASQDDVRRKILALYRRYFRFKPNTSKAVPEHHEWFDAVHSDVLRNLGFHEGVMASLSETSAAAAPPPRQPRGSDLDAGIIRHVLIEEDVVASPPDPDDGANRCFGPQRVPESSAGGPVDGVGDAHAPRMETRAKRAPSTAAPPAATRQGEPAVESSWASSVYGEVKNMIAAKWYTLEQEREQRAVLLEQHMAELRAAQATAATTRERVEEARSRFSALALGAGVEAEGYGSADPPDEGESEAVPREAAGASSTFESHDDGLLDRIRRRIADLKEEALELEGALVSWTQRTLDLERYIQELDHPTEDYLRADARLTELEAQAEFLLKNE